MTSLGNSDRRTLHLTRMDKPSQYALLADLCPPIDGSVKACVTLILNTYGIIPIPEDVTTIIAGTRDVCETKRRFIYDNMPCEDCRMRFRIREITTGHRV